MTDVLAIIPARGGSKGIPRKNLASCGGRPLVDWTIQAANDSRRITDAILSSDDPDILARAAGPKVRASWRDARMAADETPTEAVLDAHIRMNSGAAIVVLLQPTSPLRTGKHIDEAIALLEERRADSVVSVVPSHAYLWDASARPLYAERRRRQEMAQYEENGAIYVFTMEHWRRTGNRLGGHVELYVMGDEHRLQVDTPDDIEQMSLLLDRSAVPA